MYLSNEAMEPKRTLAGVSAINKVTWQRAGRVTEPGRYMLRFGWLTVTAEDLAIWQQFPEAAFTLVKIPGQADEDEFHLGAFELPGPSSSA